MKETDKQITLLEMIQECEKERGDKSNYSERNWEEEDN